MKAAPEYIHANALVLGETGLLLLGPSGAGKSALSLALIQRYEARGDFARLVGDDRIALAPVNGRLIARPHPAIAGKLEIRGLGLMRVPHEAACALAAVVEICPPGAPPPRLPDNGQDSATLHGIALPRLFIPDASDISVARIVFFLQMITTF